MSTIKNPSLCALCERKGSDACYMCKNCISGSVIESQKKTDFFLLNRHFTIIEMIDKYCAITDNCAECFAREFCQLYVMPDIILKVSKIKRDKTLNFDKLPSKDINI